jgi:inhibitor of cysteine peptidase
MRILRAIAIFFFSITAASAQNPISLTVEARTEDAAGKSAVYDSNEAIAQSALYCYVSDDSQKQGIPLSIVTVSEGHGKMMHVDQSYNGREVTLAVGQVLELALSENRTTGFRWDLKTKAEPACELVESTFNPPVGHRGNGGIHRWQFRAVQSGGGEIELEYRRPWEKDAAPARVYKLGVRVRDSGNSSSTAPVE